MSDAARVVPGAWSHTHHVEVRYGECDQQGVVFNANYLAYVDDAMDHWMRALAPNGEASPWVGSWDVMLRAAQLTWHGPARWPERISIDCGVARFGRTSFDAGFALRVEDRPVCDVLISYVSVDPGDHVPMPTPPEVVAAMGPEVPWPPVATAPDADAVADPAVGADATGR